MINLIGLTKLTEEKIDEIFKEAKTQDEYVLGLYSAVISDYDNVTEVRGYPRISEKTSKYIFEKAMRFDSKNAPKVMRGGCWMNYGFGVDPSMPDWKVNLEGVEIEVNERYRME